MMRFRRLFAPAGAALLFAAGCASAQTSAVETPENQAPIAAPAAEDATPGAVWREQARAELQARLDRPRREGRAKNVILFIADGFNLSTITATRIFDGQSQGKPGEAHVLEFERWGHAALVKTYAENAQVPDSAATSTAIQAGIKTHVGAISVYARQTTEACGPDADVPDTILDLAERRGLATGLVATARLTHATPAAAYAHAGSRNWESDAALPPDALEAGCTDLARQLIEYAEGDGVDLALGGGIAAFLPDGEGGQRADGRDLTAEWAGRGGEFVSDAAGFRALDPASDAPVLGLFSRSHMAWEADRDPSAEPSLEEMTRFAVERLSRDEDGYYLMVEAGRVDHAHHATNAYRALTDAQAFVRAIEAAAAMTDPEETLILVTADHGHVFNIAGYPRRGNPILGLVHPPAPDLSDDETPPSISRDGRPYTTLGYYNGPHQRPVGGEGLTQEQALDPDYRQEAAVPLGSETHSGEDVILFARGPWAHLADGVMEQHTIFHLMTHAYGWDRDAD